MKFLKDNIVLALGISLPLLLVALFVLAGTLPALFVDDPKHDFLFADNHYGQLRFEVVNEKLHLRLIPNQYAAAPQEQPLLYRYSAATGKVQRLSYKLPDMPKLPVQGINNVNVNTNINIPVDPTKPPTAEQARNAAKVVAEIQQNNPALQTTLFPLPEFDALRLDTSAEAPDGYHFAYGSSGYYGGGFLFGIGGSYREGRAALVKDGKKVQLHFSGSGRDYYRSPAFVGWVITP